MELDLRRHDLMQMSSMGRHCMRIAPPGKKATQKIAAGDSTGVVHVFSMKKWLVTSTFKGVPNGTPVSCLAFGRGKQGEVTDKIFYSQVRCAGGRPDGQHALPPVPARAPLLARAAGC